MNRQENNPNMNLEQAIAELRADEPSLKFCNQPRRGCGARSSRVSLPALAIPSADAAT